MLFGALLIFMTGMLVMYCLMFGAVVRIQPGADAGEVALAGDDVVALVPAGGLLAPPRFSLSLYIAWV